MLSQETDTVTGEEPTVEKPLDLAALSLSPNMLNWANFMKRGKHHKARTHRAKSRIAKRKSKR